ncbi:MAG TPA: branched-chain amino acid ABC transporter permease [Polyangiales bacterium]|nr:branched-chain amino acid ABC transporter permease [Polyangiales bacterium]
MLGNVIGKSASSTRWGISPVMVLGVLLLAFIPFALSDYQVFQLTLILANSIALMGLNLLTGYNGQISLGHGAFYAAGAYTTAILMDKFGMPYWMTIPASGLVSYGLGWAFGFPALRLGGLYLALVTFAMGICVPQVLKYKHFEHYTGGVQGITLMKPEAPFGLPLTPDHWLFLFTLVIAVAAFLGARNLLAGHTGKALIAIRDNPIAATAMGVDVARYKTTTFGISAMYTGIAGSLCSLTIQFVAPDSFQALSISFLVGIVVGGLASISGAIYGAIFIQFVPHLAENISKAAPSAIFGLLLIAFVYMLPYGIAGSIKKLQMQLQARRNAAKVP